MQYSPNTNAFSTGMTAGSGMVKDAGMAANQFAGARATDAQSQALYPQPGQPQGAPQQYSFGAPVPPQTAGQDPSVTAAQALLQKLLGGAPPPGQGQQLLGQLPPVQ